MISNMIITESLPAPEIDRAEVLRYASVRGDSPETDSLLTECIDEAKGQLVTLPSGGQLALDEGRIMEIFKENPDARASYTATLNKIAGILPEGADMYLALIPTSIEFTDSPYRSLSDSEKATIDAIYQGLAGITPVNVYDRLAENADSYMYFRTDHHWTQRGAYYGYEALMGAMGKMPIPLAEMEADKQSGFLGYLYNQAKINSQNMTGKLSTWPGGMNSRNRTSLPT